MSAERFSKETHIVNLLHRYLVENKYVIVQLVPPGGQSTYSISFSTTDGKRKTVFPDLICLNTKHILIAEAKAKFSAPDKRKLCLMRDSPTAQMSIRDLVARVTNRKSQNFPVSFCLVHGDSSATPDREIDQLVLSADKVIYIPAIPDSHKR